MHKFIVNVNGTSYEVEVEEIDSAAAGETASAPKKAAPKAIRKLRRCSHRIRLTLSRHIRKGGVNHAIHHKGFYRFCA